MAINYAHLVMLAEQRIIAREDARALRDALDAHLPRPTSARVAYDGTYEDLFFYIERLIVARLRRGRRPAGCTPRAAATTSP